MLTARSHKPARVEGSVVIRGVFASNYSTADRIVQRTRSAPCLYDPLMLRRGGVGLDALGRTNVDHHRAWRFDDGRHAWLQVAARSASRWRRQPGKSVFVLAGACAHGLAGAQ